MNSSTTSLQLEQDWRTGEVVELSGSTNKFSQFIKSSHGFTFFDPYTNRTELKYKLIIKIIIPLKSWKN